MKVVSSRIWTRLNDAISHDDTRYAEHTFNCSSCCCCKRLIHFLNILQFNASKISQIKYALKSSFELQWKHE